jgi:hypothetical protein
MHAVLLGFVTHFCGNAARNQLRENDAKKAPLSTRLSSLDVSRLGIPKLCGHTLVKYCGSLVDRDFRAVPQVAPFVLCELISPESFNVWKSLSRLVPLFWQAEIKQPGIFSHNRRTGSQFSKLKSRHSSP